MVSNYLIQWFQFITTQLYYHWLNNTQLLFDQRYYQERSAVECDATRNIVGVKLATVVCLCLSVSVDTDGTETDNCCQLHPYNVSRGFTLYPWESNPAPARPKIRSHSYSWTPFPIDYRVRGNSISNRIVEYSWSWNCYLKMAKTRRTCPGRVLWKTERLVYVIE